jgi:hypothetical protein
LRETGGAAGYCYTEHLSVLVKWLMYDVKDPPRTGRPTAGHSGFAAPQFAG